MLNRRNLFAAAPAVAVLGLPAVVSATATHDDASLIYLGQRYEEACAAYDRASREEDEAEERCLAVHVRKPVAFATQEDIDRGVGRNGGLAVGGRIPWVEVERIVRNVEDWKRLGGELYHGREVWAQKYVALKEQHRAALKAVEDRVGYTDAIYRAQAAYQHRSDLEDQIVGASCTTLAGLRVKAMVAKRLVPAVDDPENDWKDTAALSVIDIVLRMGAH